MKLICTASKVSWFTVGREYEADENMRVTDDDDKMYRQSWILEPHNGGYRTERLEDAEFAVAQADDKQDAHDDILAAVVQMAEEEDCVNLVNYNLTFFRSYWQAAAKDPKQQRAFLLALAYFAEEKSQ